MSVDRRDFLRLLTSTAALVATESEVVGGQDRPATLPDRRVDVVIEDSAEVTRVQTTLPDGTPTLDLTFAPVDDKTPPPEEEKKPTLKFPARGEEPARAALLTCDLLMRSLGRPNRDQVVTTRPDDLSTLQALDLTNGPDMTKLMAMQGAPVDDVAKQVVAEIKAMTT